MSDHPNSAGTRRRNAGLSDACTAPVAAVDVVNSHDAFRKVDELVAKPTYGSDGAMAWQSFQQKAMAKDAPTDMRRTINKVASAASKKSSLGSAPLAPLKKMDRVALGFQSWDDEVQHERNLRQQEGQSELHVGYQLFREKPTQTKKDADVENEQAKEEEDGAHDRPRKRSSVGGDGEGRGDGGNSNGLSTSTNKKKKKSKAAAAAAVIMVDTPDHPLQQVAEAIQRRQQQQQSQQQGLVGGSVVAAVAAATLPDGWESAWDSASQKHYYYHRSSGVRQWTIPSSSQPAAAAAATAKAAASAPGASSSPVETAAAAAALTDHELPTGWVAVTDPSTHKTYYYHQQSRETRWDRPTTTSTTAVANSDP